MCTFFVGGKKREQKKLGSGSFFYPFFAGREKGLGLISAPFFEKKKRKKRGWGAGSVPYSAGRERKKVRSGGKCVPYFAGRERKKVRSWKRKIKGRQGERVFFRTGIEDEKGWGAGSVPNFARGRNMLGIGNCTF